MKTKLWFVISALLGITITAGILLTSCSKSGQHEKDPNVSYYTCPMHHEIHMDHPGECPICGMTLIPVYQEGGAESRGEPRVRPDAGVRISSDRQKLIGLKTETAVKKPATKEIRTVGRVAFDPDLAVAQREYIEILKNVPSLKDAARSNLRLKGMSEEEIRELDRVGKNLYLPAPGDTVWIYATLYQEEMNLVKPGMKAVITLPSDVGTPFSGEVKSVDPVVNPMTRSGRARIEIPGAGGKLRPDSYVDVSLRIDLGEALTIPKSAVIDTGMRKVAFVVTDGQSFQSRDIKTGPEVVSASGGDVIVLEGISEGEKVVSSAAFLVDSESRLKAAASSPQSAPSCPDKQYWDVGMAMCMPKVGS